MLPMTIAERLANDLTDASSAYATGNGAELAARLNAITLAGATPQDAGTESVLKAWHNALPHNNRAAPPLRGRVLGPAYISGMLRPGATLDTQQVLLGGKSVGIAAGTAPRSGLILRIARHDGATVCEQSPAHARECRFVPTYTQRYRIILHNAGTAEAQYHIVFN